MIKLKDTISPLKNELPSSFADRIGSTYSLETSAEHKKKYAQFFTPLSIANFMAGLSKTNKSDIKILDPGCGMSILTCALVESLLKKHKNLKKVEIDAYEIDKNLVSYSNKILSYLDQWLSYRGIKLIFNIFESDFILSNIETLENQDKEKKFYDIVISNPPYFKLPKTDLRVRAVNNIVHGQPNIYSLFMYTAATLLEDNGQLIFIIPRSFTSGFYFKLFRNRFFSLVQLDLIHLFGSRKEQFIKDEVLQENVIISAIRKVPDKKGGIVKVSFSRGLKDLNERTVNDFHLDEIIDMDSSQKIIHLPASDYETKVIRLFKSWHGGLNKYNIQISTGPVVSFRAKKYILDHPDPELSLAPLYWLHNVNKMKIIWPKDKSGKGDYIRICEESMSILIPNKNYIFLRRFSSKDDKSRLIATPYFSDMIDTELIGVENRLNYIYRPKGHLERSEILGLSALLNSNLFDTYFRTINGNINVSATELRGMPLPDLNIINQIGVAILLKNNFLQKTTETIVDQFFNIDKNYQSIYV